jgi:hypothetical protein
MAKKDIGGLARMMNKTSVKPKLQVHAYMAEDEPCEVFDDSKYLKEDLARCNRTITAIENQLKTWVPEDIAAKVKKQLEANLEREQTRAAELKAQLKARKARG